MAAIIPYDAPRALPERWFFTDEARTRAPDKITRRLTRGTGVVFRHYGDPDRARTAARTAAAARRARVFLLVAGNPRLASAVRAQGVHWPEAALENPDRPPVPPWMMQTAAVHSEAALERAEAAGMDAVFASPVFAAASHPKTEPLGPEGLARICAAARIPVYALGGIRKENTQAALDAGAAGIAGIGLFL